jgi:hypothetical protein
VVRVLLFGQDGKLSMEFYVLNLTYWGIDNGKPILIWSDPLENGCFNAVLQIASMLNLKISPIYTQDICD